MMIEFREVGARYRERGVRGERGRREEQKDDEFGDVHGRLGSEV